MELYLAGGFTGNTGPLWRATVDRGISIEQSMELFLAGVHPIKNGSLANWDDLNILESYYYAKDNKYIPHLLPHARNFLLDSGAFTFMQSGEKVDWNRYVNEFADYINKHDVKLFFELDLDSVIGLGPTEKLRDLLEARTGKKVIPVWHVERGKDYFIDMCKEYDYVALGSIAKVKGGKTKITEKYFPWFWNTAMAHNSKIHALGYTPKNLKDCKFTSVDSTAWLHGNIGGFVYKFDMAKGEMVQHSKPAGSRLKSRAVAVNNYNEWVRYMKWLRTV